KKLRPQWSVRLRCVTGNCRHLSLACAEDGTFRDLHILRGFRCPTHPDRDCVPYQTNFELFFGKIQLPRGRGTVCPGFLYPADADKMRSSTYAPFIRSAPDTRSKLSTSNFRLAHVPIFLPGWTGAGMASCAFRQPRGRTRCCGIRRSYRGDARWTHQSRGSWA